MPIECDNPIVCYVTRRDALPGTGPVRGLREKIRQAVEAGADWVQIREKEMPGGALLGLAADAIEIARQQAARVGGARPAQVIVNDRLDVAIAAGCAGVHLGEKSLPVRAVSEWRRAGKLPAEFLIGASCHSLGEAVDGEAHGADYVFFGPVFASPEKMRFGPPQGLEKLREVCAGVKIPVIAIGGVDTQNAEACVGAGAAGIAAIRMFQEAADRGALEKFIARLHRLREKK